MDHISEVQIFRDFTTDCKEAAEMYRRMNLPEITAPVIEACMDEIPVEVNRDFVRDFILNGQEKMRDIIYGWIAYVKKPRIKSEAFLYMYCMYE